jgi:hypothetical protein
MDTPGRNRSAEQKSKGWVECTIAVCAVGAERAIYPSYVVRWAGVDDALGDEDWSGLMGCRRGILPMQSVQLLQSLQFLQFVLFLLVCSCGLIASS